MPKSDEADNECDEECAGEVEQGGRPVDEGRPIEEYTRVDDVAGEEESKGEEEERFGGEGRGASAPSYAGVGECSSDGKGDSEDWNLEKATFSVWVEAGRRIRSQRRAKASKKRKCTLVSR